MFQESSTASHVETPDSQPTAAPKKRGRPTIQHDNSQVASFLSCFPCLYDAREAFPWLDDIFTGVVHLQTEGQASTRPLSRSSLYRVLSACEALQQQAVAGALPGSPSGRTAYRYAAIARVASTAIARELERQPHLLPEAQNWKADRDALDAPYMADLPFIATYIKGNRYGPGR